MKQEQGADYYNRAYSKKYRSYITNIYDCICEILAGQYRSDLRILELGCGVGELAKRLIPLYPRYKGVDFSSAAIKICGDTVSGKHFICHSVYDHRFLYAQPWDIIIATQVLEHVDDIEIIKHMPHDVSFIFSVPENGDPAHLRSYNAAKIRKRYEEYLDIKSVETLRKQDGSKRKIFLVQSERK